MDHGVGISITGFSGSLFAVDRRKHLTAERIASQKIQGQYLGFLRQIPKTARKRFQELAKTKGREAAIAEMRNKLGK